MADTFGTGQVDCCDLTSTEENPEPAVAGARSDRHPLAAKSLRDFPELPPEADVGLGRADDSDGLAFRVFDFGKLSGHRTLARPIAACRHILAERLMWPFEIVIVRQASKASCDSASVRKRCKANTSALSVRWKRSFLPRVCG